MAWQIKVFWCKALRQGRKHIVFVRYRSKKVAEQQYRKARDSMGEFQVPADAYYGANTMRAKLNFPISDLRFPGSFIRALGQIKQAAAQVNSELRVVGKSGIMPCWA